MLLKSLVDELAGGATGASQWARVTGSVPWNI